MRSTKWNIDPQSQLLWRIKSRETKNQTEMTSPIDRRLHYLVLVDSMAFGTPVLIENVEEEIDSYAPRSPARTADHGAAHACYSRAPQFGTGRSGPCSPR